MNLHDNKLCKKKCDCVMNMLAEVEELLQYPRSDREQLIKSKVELVLQDIQYLSREIDGDKDDYLMTYAKGWK